MSGSNKRQAQSPLSGDDEDVKRRIIMEDTLTIISLDELSGGEGGEESDTNGGSELAAIQGKDLESKPDQMAANKVDCLINWMDRFMECFAKLHTTVSKDQHVNQRKSKHLETAHNDLVDKVVKSAESTESRMESLEAKLEETLSANAKLADKVVHLEEEHSRRASLQRQVNSLEIEQGKLKHDCRSEVKERKIIITWVPQTSGESVKVVEQYQQSRWSSHFPETTRCPAGKLKIHEIDNVFRVGKSGGGNRKHNISLTFLAKDD